MTAKRMLVHFICSLEYIKRHVHHRHWLIPSLLSVESDLPEIRHAFITYRKETFLGYQLTF